MYKFIFVLLVVVGMTTASNAQEKQNMKQSDNKPLSNRIQMPISTGMTKGRVVR